MEKFCKSPWYHININNAGVLRPCCLFWPRRPTQKNFITDDMNIFEQYQNLYDDVKEQGINHPGCGKCKKDEELGIKSRRINQEQKNSPPEGWINFIDIAFGNTCNLKCRMCRSVNSTKWIADEQYLQQNGFPLQHQIHSKFELSQKQVNDIINYCNSYPGEDFYLEVKGGEPFVTDAFLNFINGLSEGFKKKCTMRVFSNGTDISDEYIKKLSTFKKINYTLSLEATGELYNYIRGGDKLTLDDAVGTARKLSHLPNIGYTTSITTPLYSIFNQLEIAEYCASVGYVLQVDAYMNFVNAPAYLDPAILPQKYKDQLIEKYSKYDFLANVVKYLQQPQKYHDEKALLREFFTFTDLLDARRKENLYDIVPVFKEIKNEL
jgi:MoaA/NifB/PqqE/SkfB family radical SAM enzyme